MGAGILQGSSRQNILASFCINIFIYVGVGWMWGGGGEYGMSLVVTITVSRDVSRRGR